MTTTPLTGKDHPVRVDDQLAHEIATELIREAAREFEYLAIAEHIASNEDLADLTFDDEDELVQRVHDLIVTATITVEFPESAVTR